MAVCVGILLDLGIFIEVLYLFTCGNKYMRVSINRANRHFKFEKLMYALLGVVSICAAVAKNDVSIWELLVSLFVFIIILLKCITIYKLHYKAKRTNNTLL